MRILTVEIGNTRGKGALFPEPEALSARTLPTPTGPVQAWDATTTPPWERLLGETPPEDVLVVLAGSRPHDIDKLAGNWRTEAPAGLRHRQPHVVRGPEGVGIAVDVEFPERVGIDRLLAARAAMHGRDGSPPLVVVTVGTATTVNLIVEGVFRGGAILPGIDLGGRALRDHTQVLPLVRPGRNFEAAREIAAVGRNTESAIEAGLVWGQIGAVRELVRRQTEGLGAFELWLTGGGAPTIVAHGGEPFTSARHVPHLTLAGLALAARR